MHELFGLAAAHPYCLFASQTQIIMPVPESSWQPRTVEGDDSLVSLLALAKNKELPPQYEENLAFLISKQPTFNAKVSHAPTHCHIHSYRGGTGC